MSDPIMVDPFVARMEQLRADGVDQHYVVADPHKATFFPELFVAPPKPILATLGLKQDFVRKHERLKGSIAPSGYYLFDDFYVGRSGTVLDTQRRINYAPDLISPYWMWFLSKIIVSDVYGRMPSDNIEIAPSAIGQFIKRTRAHDREIDEGATIVNLVKPGQVVYGHWLLDIFPSLWNFLRCRKQGGITGEVRYLVAAGAPGWAIDYLVLGFGIDRAHLIFFDDFAEVVRVKRMLVPSMLRISPLISPAMNDYVAFLQERLLPLATATEFPDKLYISRATYATEANKKLLGEDELEALFVAKGFAAIKPERIAWPDQVAMFSQAKVIAGEFGSGIHNALFGGPDLVSLTLLHLKHNWNQSSIAALRGQELIYVAPAEQARTGIGKGITYEFDHERVTEAIGIATASRAAGASPAPAPEGQPEPQPQPEPEVAAPAEPEPLAAAEPAAPDEPQARKPTILAVATDGFAARFAFCIDSHQAYAHRHGIEYLLRTEERPPHNAQWTKIAHAIYAIAADRDVMMIDADAQIMPRTPHFQDMLAAHPDKDIFYALGESGRPNSGVMLFRGGQQSAGHAFLRACIATRATPVPPADFVTADGENGHIIHLLKRPEYADKAQEIGREWNMSQPAQIDGVYVRHYTNKLAASLKSGDMLQRISTPLAVRSEADVQLRSLLAFQQAMRDHLLTDLGHDGAQLATLRRVVRALDQRRHLSLPMEGRDEAEIWLNRFDHVADLIDAAPRAVLAALLFPGARYVDAGGDAGFLRTAVRALRQEGAVIAVAPKPEWSALRQRIGFLAPRVKLRNLPEGEPIDALLAKERADVIRVDASDLSGTPNAWIDEVVAREATLSILLRVGEIGDRRAAEPEVALLARFCDLGFRPRRINEGFTIAPPGIFESARPSTYLLAHESRWPEMRARLLLRRAPAMGRPAIEAAT